ncbi:MAG: AtpZ/AtpI family protein [Candidatus Taylorbacteria bacterium]|nr:AtpZ/AtpI family protein [Candidatus Taylorbacteria bacterium]
MRDKNPWWKPAIEILGQVSMWVVVPIMASLFIGKYLDTRYGTSPWMFLTLSCIGFIISSFGIVRTTKDYLQKLENEVHGKPDNTNKPKIGN